jgi:hypothetical protein
MFEDKSIADLIKMQSDITSELQRRILGDPSKGISVNAQTGEAQYFYGTLNGDCVGSGGGTSGARIEPGGKKTIDWYPDPGFIYGGGGSGNGGGGHDAYGMPHDVYVSNIIDALKAGHKSLPEISKHAKITSDRRTHDVLDWMRRKGMVEYDMVRGSWHLPQKRDKVSEEEIKNQVIMNVSPKCATLPELSAATAIDPKILLPIIECMEQDNLLKWRQQSIACEREYALTDEGEKLKKKLTHKGTAA